jgi:hypothetical protein
MKQTAPVAWNACTVCGTIYPTFIDRKQCAWHLPGSPTASKEQST